MPLQGAGCIGHGTVLGWAGSKLVPGRMHAESHKCYNKPCMLYILWCLPLRAEEQHLATPGETVDQASLFPIAVENMWVRNVNALGEEKNEMKGLQLVFGQASLAL